MKYMGSKRAMLQNGLGDLLDREAAGAHRFVDLFAGSGSVAIHIARKFPIPVLAFDPPTTTIGVYRWPMNCTGSTSHRFWW